MSGQPPESPRGRLAAVAMLVILVAGSLWLVHRLQSTAAVQDCVAVGRHDCAAP